MLRSNDWISWLSSFHYSSSIFSVWSWRSQQFWFVLSICWHWHQPSFHRGWRQPLWKEGWWCQQMQVVDSKLASVTFLIICKLEVFTHSSAMLLSSIKAFRMEMLNTHQWALWSGTFPGLSFAACMVLRQTSLFSFSCSACSAILLSCIKALPYRLVWSNLGADKYWFDQGVALFNWISSSLLPAVRKRGLYLLKSGLDSWIHFVHDEICQGGELETSVGRLSDFQR